MLELIKTGSYEMIKAEIERLDRLGGVYLRNALAVINEEGQTLLHVAAQRGDIAIVRELLSLERIEVLAQDTHHRTASQLAEESGHEEVAALLRIKGIWETKSSNQNFKLSKMLDLLEPAVQAASAGRDKELVLLVGNTGSGKSTLMNYLMGCQYHIETEPDTAIQFATLKSGQELARVGHGVISQTLYPQVIDSGREYAYCDLAGLFENRGNEARVCAASSSEMLKRISSRIKAILFIVEHDALKTGKAEYFKKVALGLKRILGEHYQETLASVFLVITKTEGAGVQVTPKGIQKIIGQILGNNEYTNNESSNEDNGLLARANKGELSLDETDLMNLLKALYEHTDQTLIANITDNGESRRAIINTVESAEPKNKNYFNFMLSEPIQVVFNNMLLEVANELAAMQAKEKEIQELIYTEQEKQTHAQQKITSLETTITNNDILVGSIIPRVNEQLGELIKLFSGVEAKLFRMIHPYNFPINITDLGRFDSCLIDMPGILKFENGSFEIQLADSHISLNIADEFLGLRLDNPQILQPSPRDKIQLVERSIARLSAMSGQLQAQKTTATEQIPLEKAAIENSKQRTAILEKELKRIQLDLAASQELQKAITKINEVLEIYTPPAEQQPIPARAAIIPGITLFQNRPHPGDNNNNNNNQPTTNTLSNDAQTPSSPSLRP